MNKADLIEKIAKLVKDGVVEGIQDLRDESDRTGMRIVVVIKREYIPKTILKILFSKTPLHSRFNMLMLALIGNEPKVFNLKEALEGADVINLLRIQHERQRASFFPSINEYASIFGVNSETIKYVKPDALIMHPGPINRNVELDSVIADGPQSVILEQVTNGLAVRMAILFLVAGCLENE